MTNVETIKDLIIRFGEPWNEHHRDDLGIEYAERVISMYDREGLTYYFQRCREWVSVQTIFIDLDGTVRVSCFSNNTNENHRGQHGLHIYCCGINLLTKLWQTWI